MNGFTKKSVGTLTLGEKLKKLRSDKRISLGEVSRFTRIKPEYLEALEEGDYDALPVDVYVKGFLRSYADFLGVDEKILIKLYNKEKGIKKNLEKGKKPEGEKRRPINISSFVFTPQKIAIAAAVVLVLAGLFFLYREVDSFASAPSLVIISPDGGSEVSGNSVYIKGVTEKDALLFINGQPILVGDDGSFGESVTLQSGLNSISVKAVNKFKKETVKNVVIKSDYAEPDQSNPPNASNAKTDQNQASDVAGETQGLTVKLHVDPGPVWLSVETDGSLAFSGTMLSGTTQIFKATDKIMISSGKGNATFITLNGKDLGVLSQDPGAVRNVTITKDTQMIPAPDAAADSSASSKDSPKKSNKN